MNKRNTKLTGLTSIALAAAALAVAPMSAQAGDIYSIEPVWGDETSGRADTGDCSENPLTLGEQATFIFRLYDSGVQSNPTVRNDTSNFWRLNYKGAGSVTVAELSGAMPKIGVYVSGRLKFAEIVDVSATKGYEGNFSDIKCRYIVDGGDIALPLTLADSNGNEIGSADTSATYYFLNPYEWWAIEDKNGNPVSLSFGSESVAGLAPKPTATRNYSLASIDDSIYIRAVDFDEDYDTPPDPNNPAAPVYWRRVYEGMTTTKTSQPSIYVPGGNSTNEATVLYLWVENTNAVSLADATLSYSDTVRRGGTDVDVSFPVQKITLGKGQTNLTFRLQGVTAGETAEVFLAATKGYRKNAVGDIITNFVTRTVYCEAAPDPFVAISFAKDETDGEVEATTNYTKSAVTMYVKLSKEYTEDIWVDINPTVVGDAAFDVFEEKVIGVSLNDGNYNQTFTNRLVKVPAGEKQVPFYVYALGATADTAAYEGGITFTPTLADPRNSAAARAFFNGEFVYSRLRVTDQAPIIVSPEDGKSYSGWVAQGDQLVSIKINDNYRDLLSNSTYTVTWSYGDGSVDTFTLSPTNRLLNVTVKYPSKGSFASTVTVADQNGNVSNEINLNVTVLAPKTVMANLYDSTSQTTKNERSEYAEGEKPLLKFELSQPHTATLYAFLVPLNAASSNLVTSAAFEGGIVIQPNTTLSTPVSFNLNFLDGGTAAADLQFGIMLRNADRYDQGEEVTGVYTPETLYIYATNVAPVITSVEINNGHVDNGGTFESKVSSGVPTKFDATLFDPAVIDITNGLVTCWTIRDGMAGHYVYKKFWVTNDTVNASCSYTFSTGGEMQTVSVRAQDKDMLDLGPEYTFTVEIDDPPYVQIINSNADRHYAENSKDGYVIAALSTPASDDLVVELTATRQGLDGILEFATNYVTIAAGDTIGVPQNIRFSNLDGTVDSKTAGFIVTAKVITNTSNAYDQAWSDYYKSKPEYVYVDNVAPVISRPGESSITNKVTLNSKKEFIWDIKDIAEDLTNGLSVTWTSSGGEQTTFTGPDVATGIYTNTFTSEGPLEVSVLVEDKDGGQAMRTWYFVVNPTKKVGVNPYGPSPSTSSKYLTAQGRGKGRVWGDSGTCEINRFYHTWIYDISASQATIYAFGYAGSANAAGYADNGNLGPGNMDVAITSSGDKWQASSGNDYYTYKDKFDNYFYCWVDDPQSGGLEGVSGVPRPAVGPLVDTRVTIPLAEYEGGTNANKVVETRNIEAIFASEKFLSDNMGDINADGIPDFFYTVYWYNGSDAGGGLEGGSGAGDDLADLSGFNDDNDFLPGAGAASSALIPGLPETWTTEGRPFSAYLEIRGFGDGLNDAPARRGYTDFKPAVDFQNASYNAMVNNWKSGYKGAKGPQGLEWIRVEWLAYNELSEAEKAEWSPENPTDPTKDDSDDDGFTDGYEYYYWYYAKVGYIEERTGRHLYITGSKYNPADPSRGDVITSAQIVEMFNPNVYNDKARTRDTDKDGLTDLQEFYLGTNPIQWDTDGDGLPDGYEVMIGMNPLVEATSTGTHDAYSNPDRDYMAYSLIGSNAYDKPFRVFGVEADGGHVKYVAIRSDAEIASEFTASDQPGWLVSVLDESGEVSNYITLGDETGDVPYGTTPDGQLVLKCELDEFRTWRARTNDSGDWVRGEPVFLPRGTYLDVDPDPTVNWYTESFTMEWPSTNSVPNHAWRAWMYGKNTAPLCDNCGGSGKIADYTVIPSVETDCPVCGGTGHIYDSAGPTWGGFVLGQDLSVSPGLVVLFEVNKPTVALIHHHVYQWRQFDPRTGWGGTSVNTRPFATYDEFLLISFFYNTGALSDSRIKAETAVAQLSRWGAYNTNPLAEGRSTDYDVGISQTVAGSDNHGADTDGDGVPDGWELYVMAGPRQADGRFKVESPLSNRGPLKAANWSNSLLDEDKDSLGFREEFESVQSTRVYSDYCPTIQRTAGWTWYNKRWPTDPWNTDTDDDGLRDDEEQSLFSYGTPRLAGTHNGAVEGGGLNPLSWDTDGDGLPDPWEAQYAGTPTPISARTGTEPSGGSEDEVQTSEIVNGMDGTSADETTAKRPNVLGTLDIIDRDYDHDGLQNWQEYQTGMMRCWRYDDPISPWDKMPDFGDTSDPAFDWGNVLLNRDDPTVYNPHLTTVYDPTAYYCSLQTNEWDTTGYGRWYMFPDGPYHELSRPSDKYLDGDERNNRWTYYAKNTLGTDLDHIQYIRKVTPMIGVYAEKYFSCSPINFDSDNDGMDDYYECFHGMNPILGVPASDGDLIFAAYGGGSVLGRKFNALTTYRSPECEYNFVFEPWLAGVPTADPDGDNIRNQEEAIMPRVQALSTWHHTDPTPLWMTDTSYEPGENIDDDPGSLTVRFYQTSSSKQISLPGATFEYDSDGDGIAETHRFEMLVDRYDRIQGVLKQWQYSPAAPGTAIARIEVGEAGPIWYGTTLGEQASVFYSFEENEGYDSDHDGLSDYAEAAGKYRNASDGQDDDSPSRHQAMYFNGTDAFLETLPESTEGGEGAVVNNMQEMMFLEYTAEAWVLPEDLTRAQTILERAVATDSSHVGDEKLLRRNFSIGIDASGNWYALHDSRGTDKLQTIVVTGPAATEEWTHLAVTFGAKAGAPAQMTLYVNGRAVNTLKTNVQPENGTASITIDTNGVFGTKSQYRAVALLVGTGTDAENDADGQGVWAYANRLSGLYPDYDNFTGYFKGYVDEVRVWDGARSAEQIAANYRKRFTADDIRENRSILYYQTQQYGVRSDAANQDLEPELRYLFGFDHSFGADSETHVAKVPAGFDYAGVDGKGILSRPDGWVCPWWDSLPCKSTVYDNYAWVPWINNMYHHLDRFDGTTKDSRYWSKYYAGVVSAPELELSMLSYPQTHEVYSIWNQAAYGVASKYLLYVSSTNATNASMAAPYEFARRQQLTEGADLLPFGGAYVKYTEKMWDDGKASSMWEITGTDSDNDGLPDWWEAQYGNVGWNDIVTYNGVEMEAGEAYKRSLAAGAHEGSATGDALFAQKSDLDKDGIADWWEQIYKIENEGGDDDADQDGLSNYSEYVISEAFRSLGVYLSPVKLRSDDVTLDYFRTIGYLYLGEMFTDHDMMEDEWERSLDDLDYVSPWVWDASFDKDEDGWSAFAECRYHYFRCSLVANLISHVMGEEEVRDIPRPTIRATFRYHGSQSLVKSGSENTTQVVNGIEDNNRPGATFYVNAYSSYNPASGVGPLQVPDATFKFSPGETVSDTLYLGAWEDRVVHVTFAPGYLDLDSLKLEVGRVPRSDSYSWSENGQPRFGTYEQYMSAFRANPTGVVLATEDFNWSEMMDHFVTVTTDSTGVKGYICFNGERAGWIDLQTGEASIDLSPLQQYYTYMAAKTDAQGNQTQAAGAAWNMTDAILRMGYSAKVPATQKNNLTISLSKPDSGYLKEGLTTFVAFADLDGDGKFTPGEPMGMVRNVDVGWGTSEFCVELTDTNPVFARVRLSDLMNDREVIFGAESSNVTNEVPGTLSGGQRERIRVIRTKVDGYDCSALNVPYRQVLDKWVNLDQCRDYIFEGDFLSDTDLDLDWQYFSSEVGSNTRVTNLRLPLTNIVYRVVLGNGSTDAATTETNNLLGISIVRQFDASRTVPVPVSPMNGTTIYSARPTFEWSLGELNTYTAFKLHVYSGNTVIYDSGVRPLPARNSRGNYEWTAPLYANSMTPSGKMFNAGANYTWAVSVYNSKFRGDSFSARTATNFRMNTNSTKPVADNGYTSIGVNVSYFGPQQVLSKAATANTAQGKVRVQAFASPDFSGYPTAETIASLTAAQRTVNVQIPGLPKGEWYIRAFIDWNGNCRRDEWESWGYACNREGMVSGYSRFSPVPVVIDEETVEVPQCDVYIEDCDTDGDWFPDAYEMATKNSLTTLGPVASSDGLVNVNPDLATSISHELAASLCTMAGPDLDTLQDAAMAALILGVDTTGYSSARTAVAAALNAQTLEPAGVTITDISVVGGKVNVTSDVDVTVNGGGLSGAKAIYTGQVSGEVVYKVWYKKNLTDADWTLLSTQTKHISESGEVVSEIQVTGTIDPESGFFKVTIE